jgi:ADP-heptose:LPS heptosyltransferase
MKRSPHLIVFRFSAMGDVAMLVPVFRCLFSQNPDLKVTLVTKPFFVPIFKEFSQLQIITPDFKNTHKGIKGLWALFLELKAIRPTAVADLHAVLRTHVLRQFFRVFGYRVCKINKGRQEKRRLTRSNNKIFVPLQTTHYRYAEVFSKLGLAMDMTLHHYPDPPILTAALAKDLPEKTVPWIGIAPFAAHAGKVYPLDLMQKVVAYLQKDHHVFLFGGGDSEAQQCALWEKAYPKVTSVAARFSFADELLLISSLNAMLSMDSGNAHLASNYSIPVVTLWGQTHPFAGFAPFGQPASFALTPDRVRFPKLPTSVYGAKTPTGYSEVMRTITPKQVIETVLGALHT